LLQLIEEEPSISILVLGANPGPKGPGPLVSMLTGKMVGRLRVPITIVPGNLTLEDVDKVS
ncbi:MAG TPA: universal stress protein, partial [Alphaproteobacteria bacterium]